MAVNIIIPSSMSYSMYFWRTQTRMRMFHQLVEAAVEFLVFELAVDPSMFLMES